MMKRFLLVICLFCIVALNGNLVLASIVLERNGGILTQSMLNKCNQVYIINHIYTTTDGEIAVPENCTIIFRGGCIESGKLKFNNTIITGTPNAILCKISGRVVGDYSIDIFGITPQKEGHYNSQRISEIKNAVHSFIFAIGTYVFSEPINVGNETFCGRSKTGSVLLFPLSKGFVYRGQPKNSSMVSRQSVIQNLTIKSKGDCIDLLAVAENEESWGNAYSTYENLVLESDQGSCFYQTSVTGAVYANLYSNIIGISPQGALFNNVFLGMSSVKSVSNKYSRYYMRNCVFVSTGVSNANLGFGGALVDNLHVIVFDDEWRYGWLNATVTFSDCNFEEYVSNLIVNHRKDIILDISFNNVLFNVKPVPISGGNKSVCGHVIYYISPIDGNIKSRVFNDEKDVYVPIVGYNLYINFYNCSFVWYNELDRKRFPSIVSTVFDDISSIRRVSFPSSQKYSVFLLDSMSTIYIEGN